MSFQKKIIPPFLQCLVWESNLQLHLLIKRLSFGMLLSSLLSLCFSCPSTASLHKEFVSVSATRALLLPTIKKDQVCMEPTVGQRSDFLVRHLQELRIHVPGTFPFWVEEELVIAAISTNRCVTQRSESESVNTV